MIERIGRRAERPLVRPSPDLDHHAGSDRRQAYEEMRREALPVVESHNEVSDGSFRNTLRYLLFEGSPV